MSLNLYFDNNDVAREAPEYSVTIYFDTEKEQTNFEKRLKNMDKYRWHDLRKNTADLPPVEEEVEVVVQRRSTRVQAHAVYENGNVYMKNSLWYWDTIGARYDEDKDDWLVPQGWYEYHHYESEDNYNFIEDTVIATNGTVIAWRYIEPFEEEEE